MGEDVLDLLDSNETPFKPLAPASDAKENLYEKVDIKPIRIDVSTFNPAKKTFTVLTNMVDTTLPVTIENKLLELAAALSAKNYTLRHGCDAKDVFQNKLIATEGLKVESYLPWKSFNPNVISTVKKLTAEAYGIAANSHKIFARLPNPVRAILAKDVHVLLGESCKDPVAFMLIYMDDNSETVTKSLDYKKAGSITFYLKVAEDSNIPVFNLKNENAVSRLLEFLKTREPAPQQPSIL